MKQLGGDDDLWFAIDTDSTPMHLLTVGTYDPAASGSVSIDLHDVKRFLRERLGGLPLRQKLLPVPWNADYGAVPHRRNQELVRVGRDVVDDRHGRTVVAAPIAEYLGPMWRAPSGRRRPWKRERSV